jgi:hypothetical protein
MDEVSGRDEDATLRYKFLMSGAFSSQALAKERYRKPVATKSRVSD